MFKKSICIFFLLAPTISSAQSIEESAAVAAEAAKRAEAALEIAVPSGAVMAFDLPNCPRGWSAFEASAGRTIIGAGEGNRDQFDRRLTLRMHGQSGGAETHTLNVNEMPSHTHGFTDNYYANNPSGRWFGGTGRNGTPSAPTADDVTQAAGGGQPHNNMPPYYVLTMCKRD